MTLTMDSCRTELFDPEVYNEVITKSFPVDNIDAWQTWATLGTAQATVTVNGDYGQDYQVGFYLKNPSRVSSAICLYHTTAQSGQTLHASFSYPLSQPFVYLGVFDSYGHRIVQPLNIIKDSISTMIGCSSVGQPAKTYEAYVKTMEQYLNPAEDIKGQASKLQRISIDEMQQYTSFTDDDLQPAGNTQLSDASFGKGDARHYRVAAGTEITRVFHLQRTSGIVNDAVLYIEGKVHLNGNTLRGVTLVVAQGGELTVDSETRLAGGSRFVVMPGGKLTSRSSATLTVDAGAFCYNAGSMNTPGKVNMLGCNFYNAGTVEAGVLSNASQDGTQPLIINFGQISVTTNNGQGDAAEGLLVNGCYWKFKGDAGIYKLLLLENSRMDIGGKARFSSGKQYLCDKSMLQANTLCVCGTSFFGPEDTSGYAVLKAQKIYFTDNIYINQNKDYQYQNESGIWLAQYDNSRGTVYFDWNYSESYDQDGREIISDDGRSMLSVMQASEYKYVTESTVPDFVTIPASDCSGSGYNTREPGQAPTTIAMPVEKQLSYCYCFENTFPEVGDYDFNDAVITVTPVIDGRTAQLTVSLDAVGALDQMAAAIRLVGLKPSDLAAAPQVSGREDINADLPESYRIIKTDDNVIPDNMKCAGSQQSVVLNLFDNAHWAMSKETTNGMVQSFYCNTMKSNNDPAVYFKTNVPARTVTYTFQLTNDEAMAAFTQNQIDVFIIKGYNGGFWEVHTLPWKTDEVLSDFASGRKSVYGNNIPWAICVPSTWGGYPLEGKSIHQVYDGSHVYANGSSFTRWAQNRNAATDWYLYPATGMTY